MRLRFHAAIRWTLPLLVSAIGGCDTLNLPKMNELVQATGNQAKAELQSRNASATWGTLTFKQRGASVVMTALIYNLTPGAHSIYIHQTGNCASPNAAGAGPVWNPTGAPVGQRRAGELPLLNVGTEGNVSMTTTLDGLSIGTHGLTDIMGHSVVVHDSYDRDPKPEYGVRNGWIACGVIESY